MSLVASRALADQRFSATPVFSWNSEKFRLLNMVLIILLVLSAFAVIYIKDVNRRHFIQYQALQITHDKLYEDWRKLMLEQSTWSTQARVQKIAQNRLGMNIPSSKEVIILRRSKV